MRNLPPRRSARAPPTAGLVDDIAEIDQLLAASRRARTSVAERAAKLLEEHQAVQRGFERELQQDTLRQKPGARLRPARGADHALLFHLGAAGGQRAEEAASPGRPPREPRSARPEPPEDAVVPPPPAYASEAEAQEWDDYYRYCARGALFKALDRGRLSEREIGSRLAALALEGDHYGLGLGDAAALEAEERAARRREVRAELDAQRRRNSKEASARLEAYGPRQKKDPGHQRALRELGLTYPSPQELVREAEAAVAAERRAEREAARERALAPAPAPSEDEGDFLEEDEPPPAAAREKKAPLTAAYIAEKSSRVAAEMAGVIRGDPHVARPMADLPSNPAGLVDAEGRPAALSSLVGEHTVQVDLSFPSLDSYRRTEHDVAAYFMPQYTAHLSEPHGGGGGFWSGVRAGAAGPFRCPLGRRARETTSDARFRAGTGAP